MVTLLVGLFVLLLLATTGAYFICARTARSKSIARPDSPAVARSSPTVQSTEDATPAGQAEQNVETGPTSLPIASSPYANVRLVKVPRSPFVDSRVFERREFPGTALATIYPYDLPQDSQPYQCEVNTRDISCNGIGIAHTDQLYPSQMIVVQAFGKLLVGEVRWCHRVDTRFYIAGCRLVKADA